MIKRLIEFWHRSTINKLIGAIAGIGGVLAFIFGIQSLKDIDISRIWKNTKTRDVVGWTESLEKDTIVYKDYFVPTHVVSFIKNLSIPIRNRALTDDESWEIGVNSAEGAVLHAQTLIGLLANYAYVKLLDRTNRGYKIQYWDGEKCLIGYISDEIRITPIKPIKENNPYGLGKGLITIYTTITSGVGRIYVNDSMRGLLTSYYSEFSSPDCNDDDHSRVFKIILQAGEHVVVAEDNDGFRHRIHVSLLEGNCEIIKISN